MNNTSTKRAFSLVDIMVYMAILAVVIGLAFTGITLAQRASRDEERRITVATIRTEVDRFFRTNAAYPIETSSLVWAGTKVTVGSKDIPLSGFKQYSAAKTDANQTRYTYQKDRSGYIFCVKLETGDWFRSGNGGDTLKCPVD